MGSPHLLAVSLRFTVIPNHAVDLLTPLRLLAVFFASLGETLRVITYSALPTLSSAFILFCGWELRALISPESHVFILVSFSRGMVMVVAAVDELFRKMLAVVITR